MACAKLSKVAKIKRKKTNIGYKMEIKKNSKVKTVSNKKLAQKNNIVQAKNNLIDVDKKFMALAIRQAQKAFKNEEVPVGCVIVQNNKVIGRGYNQKERRNCALYHAELIAIKQACKKNGDWRLCGCTLYVTMEPCAMCAGAIVNHRIKSVVIGVMEQNFGACGSGIDILNNKSLNTKTSAKTGVLQSQCKQMLQNFFKQRRSIAKQKPKVC